MSPPAAISANIDAPAIGSAFAASDSAPGHASETNSPVMQHAITAAAGTFVSAAVR